MSASLIINTADLADGQLIDIHGTKKEASDSLTAAAALLANTATGVGAKVASKVAQKAARSRLSGMLRRLDENGHVVVWAENRDGVLLEAQVLADIHPTTEHTLQNPSDLKATLRHRIKDAPIQFLDHPQLGYGGRVIGHTSDLNEDRHLAYYVFLDHEHRLVTEFELSRPAEDDEKTLQKHELDILSEVIKRTTIERTPEA